MNREEDFTAFVLARSARLVYIAEVLCGDPGLAEDLVQTALEKTYVRWDRIQLADPYAYVRKAVVNHHLSWLRRKPRREALSGDSAEIEAGITTHVTDHAPRIQYQAAMTAALRALTRRERATVLLRYFEDLSEAQTAQILGVAVGTVKSTTARALDKLRHSPDLADIYIGENS